MTKVKSVEWWAKRFEGKNPDQIVALIKDYIYPVMLDQDIENITNAVVAVWNLGNRA